MQLATRVIGHEFNSKHDDLAKVYDSWYEFFRHVRMLAEEAMLYREADKELADATRYLVLDKLLGAIMRPHLTNHQRPFRHWLERVASLDKSLRDLQPQELQREYPEWAKLEGDLKSTQQKIAGVKVNLEQLLFPQRSHQEPRKRTRPL